MLAITDYINNDFKAIKSSDSIESVMDFFEESRFSHFPVVDEGVYIGCISSEEVETYDLSKKISDYLCNLANTTCLVASGYLPFAKKCDLIIWLEKGKIKHIGAPNSILPLLNLI